MAADDIVERRFVQNRGPGDRLANTQKSQVCPSSAATMLARFYREQRRNGRKISWNYFHGNPECAALIYNVESRGWKRYEGVSS